MKRKRERREEGGDYMFWFFHAPQRRLKKISLSNKEVGFLHELSVLRTTTFFLFTMK